MNRIRQHIPAFIDTGRRAETAEFETVKQLLELPFVTRWREVKDFAQFSYSGGPPHHLMAHTGAGQRARYWVVGTLSEKVEGLERFEDVHRELCRRADI